MDTKELVSSLVDDIIAGENAQAVDTFNNVISIKVNDALDTQKTELAKTVFSGTEDGSDEQQEEPEAADDNAV